MVTFGRGGGLLCLRRSRLGYVRCDPGYQIIVTANVGRCQIRLNVIQRLNAS